MSGRSDDCGDSVSGPRREQGRRTRADDTASFAPADPRVAVPVASPVASPVGAECHADAHTHPVDIGWYDVSG
ncbi:hypothetical protein [Streptomyces griseus]|uniref:hypothetical protein n=1 Tax=Streptomyces griseus TaxID=1911 RepID=UPI00055E8BC5|nr:hypothetical protein [Streptomyces griseus]